MWRSISPLYAVNCEPGCLFLQPHSQYRNFKPIKEIEVWFILGFTVSFRHAVSTTRHVIRYIVRWSWTLASGCGPVTVVYSNAWWEWEKRFSLVEGQNRHCYAGFVATYYLHLHGENLSWTFVSCVVCSLSDVTEEYQGNPLWNVLSVFAPLYKRDILWNISLLLY
jgi:hypothetical protein